LWVNQSEDWYYQCAEAVVRHAGKLCQSVRGRPIDEAISALLVESVAPAAIEVALAVQEEIAHRIEEAKSLRRSQLERARYEAELARRRYLKVDPDNRLVADALEADWNDRLRQLDTLQREHERQRATDRGLLSEEARARILSLAKDFWRVWNDPRTAPIERKRMVALLIEDVTLVKADKNAIHVRFRGGKTTSLAIDKPKPVALIRKTLPEVVRTVDELLETCTDRQVAARLNELGYRNWRGQSFTAKKVIVIRMAYRLKSRFERLRGRVIWTMARYNTFDTAVSTIGVSSSSPATALNGALSIEAWMASAFRPTPPIRRRPSVSHPLRHRRSAGRKITCISGSKLICDLTEGIPQFRLKSRRQIEGCG
jgi:hypothetical protein